MWYIKCGTPHSRTSTKGGPPLSISNMSNLRLMYQIWLATAFNVAHQSLTDVVVLDDLLLYRVNTHVYRLTCGVDDVVFQNTTPAAT